MRVPQRIDEMEMERPGEADGGRPVTGLRGGAFLRDVTIQDSEKVVIDNRHELRDDTGLERAMRLVHALDIRRSRTRHEGAAIGNDLDPAVGAEPVEHLAGALARNAEQTGKLLFGKLGAGGQLSFEDGARNLGVNRLVEIGAAPCRPALGISRSHLVLSAGWSCH